MSKQEFIRFSFVGLMYTLFGAFVFWLFVDQLHTKGLIVYLIYVPLAFVARYFCNKSWVFKQN